MALQCYVDAFNIGTGAAASTVVRTGYGFQPKACVYWWSGRTESAATFARKNPQMGMGLATSPTNRACVTGYSQDAAATMITNRRHDAANVIATSTFTTVDVLEGSADLQSFDSASGGGQTLVITDAFAASYRIHCLALGGSDLTNAAVVQFQVPTTPGSFDITTVGFQPDALLLLTCALGTAPAAVSADNFLSLGVATAAGDQGNLAIFDLDAQGTSIAAKYGYGAEVLAGSNTIGAMGARMSFTSMLSTGFRCNVLETLGNTYYIWALALQGGSYAVGNLVTSTTLNATIAESGLGFAPTGGLLLSHAAAQNTQDVSVAQANVSLGAFTSPTNRACQSIVSMNAANSAQCASSVREDACLQMLNSHTVSAGVVDVQTMDADGFTLIMDVADVTTTKYVTYLAFGTPAGFPPLTATLPGITATPAAASTVLRGLSAMLPGASTTPAAAATLPTLHLLTAALPGSSTTPAAASVLVTQHNLVATATGVTTTPPAAVTQQRVLLATMAGSTATPASAAQTLRRLSALTTGTSVTPPAAVQMTGIVTLVALVPGATTTPTSAQQVLHRLTVALTGASVTPTAAPNVLRSLTASLVAATVTPPATAPLLRGLSATLLGASATPPAAAVTSTLRLLTATAPGTTSTPTTVIQVARRLLATVSGITTTPAVVVQMAGLVQLAATVPGITTTPSSAATQLHRFSALLPGSTTTPTALVATARALGANVAGLSSTPTAQPQTQRGLSATVAASSTTPLATVQVAGVHQFFALLAGLTTTPSSAVTQLHRLASAVLSVTTTPPVAGSTLRGVQAVLAASSATPTAAALLTTVRPLQATVAGTTQTPSIQRSLARGLTSAVSGVTSTLGATTQTVHRLLAQVAGATLTPPALGGQGLQLVSTLAGVSSTAAVAWTISRSLVGAMVATSTTDTVVLVTDHSLAAQLVGVSTIPDPLLIPNSGEVQLHAALASSSATSAVDLILLTRQRIGTVMPGSRGAPVPIRGRGAYVVRAGTTAPTLVDIG
jgi:hypothetical protein